MTAHPSALPHYRSTVEPAESEEESEEAPPYCVVRAVRCCPIPTGVLTRPHTASRALPRPWRANATTEGWDEDEYEEESGPTPPQHVLRMTTLAPNNNNNNSSSPSNARGRSSPRLSPLPSSRRLRSATQRRRIVGCTLSPPQRPPVGHSASAHEYRVVLYPPQHNLKMPTTRQRRIRVWSTVDYEIELGALHV